MAVRAEVREGTTPPSVEITTDETQVWRREGSEQVLVRGAVVDGKIVDYEAPQERTVKYVTRTSSTGPIMMPDVGVWLINPARPEISVRLKIHKEGLQGWERAGDESVASIPGRAYPIVISWTRKAPTGEIKIVTTSREEQFALRDAIATGGPMLISSPSARWPLWDTVEWVSIGDVSQDAQRDLLGRITWIVSMQVTAVERPNIIRGRLVRIQDLRGTIGDLPGTIGNLGDGAAA